MITPEPRDHGSVFRALDDVADLHRELRDTRLDRDHWRELAEQEDAAVHLNAILTRCRDVVTTDESITGPALALELLSLAGTTPEE